MLNLKSLFKAVIIAVFLAQFVLLLKSQIASGQKSVGNHFFQRAHRAGISQNSTKPSSLDKRLLLSNRLSAGRL